MATDDYGNEGLVAKDIYDRILDAERVFGPYNAFCDRIDRIYSDKDSLNLDLVETGWTDRRYDTFWASMEVLKPAIYARTPHVVAKPRFSDANATDKLTAEIMERVLNSEFERSHIHEHMLMVRDDLAITNRGVLWVTHDDEDGNATCGEWLDRCDFMHEPARSWPEVSWVARRAWLTLEEMKERFRSKSGDAYLKAFFGREYGDGFNTSESFNGYDEGIPEKAAVWEYWCRESNKVYWVTEGVEEFLDEADPWINLKDFFPCPRPAYGTLARRSLIPVPDYRRYEANLDQINRVTRKIYDLLDEVQMRGLVAGSGSAAQAVESAMREKDVSSLLIPVDTSSMHLVQGAGGLSSMVQWLPMVELSQTIQGLIEAREMLFMSFDRLSGISDIMRGESEAEETLGAQRLKSQYGSVRVKDKKDELIRISRDAARIAGEIICETFSQEELLDIAQMQVPTRREVDKAIKDLEKQARAEMEELTEGVEQAAPQDEEQAAQIEQQFQQAQAQIAEKYRPQFEQLANTVVIEDVMRLIRDDRGRALIIDIENDSTVMTDELAEKQVRGEFLTGFSNALAAVQPLMGAGEQGAKLAGAMLKFALEPFSPSRDLQSTIDEFVENAPQIAAAMGQEGGDAEGVQALAEAEMEKARAQMAKVEADSQLKQAENERKVMELQQKAQKDQMALMAEQEKLRQANEANMVKAEEALAKVDLIRAQTMKAMADAGVVISNQQLDEFKSLADIEIRTAELQNKVQQQQVDNTMRVRGEMRAEADRQQGLADQQTSRESGE